MRNPLFFALSGLAATVALADDRTPMQNSALNVLPQAMLGGFVIAIVLLACMGFAQKSDSTSSLSYADKLIRYGGGLVCLMVIGIAMFTFAK